MSILLKLTCFIYTGFKERGKKLYSTSALAISRSWWQLLWLPGGWISPTWLMSSTMTCPTMWTNMCTGLVSNFNLADLILLVMTSLMNTMNCDFPIGRTGRVGNLGKATSFIDPEGDGDVMPKLVDMLTKVSGEKAFKNTLLAQYLDDASGGGRGAGVPWRRWIWRRRWRRRRRLGLTLCCSLAYLASRNFWALIPLSSYIVLMIKIRFNQFSPHAGLCHEMLI